MCSLIETDIDQYMHASVDRPVLNIIGCTCDTQSLMLCFTISSTSGLKMRELRMYLQTLSDYNCMLRSTFLWSDNKTRVPQPPSPLVLPQYNHEYIYLHTYVATQ